MRRRPSTAPPAPRDEEAARVESAEAALFESYERTIGDLDAAEKGRVLQLSDSRAKRTIELSRLRALRRRRREQRRRFGALGLPSKAAQPAAAGGGGSMGGRVSRPKTSGELTPGPVYFPNRPRSVPGGTFSRGARLQPPSRPPRGRRRRGKGKKKVAVAPGPPPRPQTAAPRVRVPMISGAPRYAPHMWGAVDASRDIVATVAAGSASLSPGPVYNVAEAKPLWRTNSGPRFSNVDRFRAVSERALERNATPAPSDYGAPQPKPRACSANLRSRREGAGDIYHQSVRMTASPGPIYDTREPSKKVAVIATPAFSFAPAPTAERRARYEAPPPRRKLDAFRQDYRARFGVGVDWEP